MLATTFLPLLLAVLVLCPPPVAAQDPSFSGTVVGVIDGDTLTIRQHDQVVTVRLQGVDCPEGGQAFGATAKEFTSALVFGRTVIVTPRGQDRYGRLVADAAVEGEDLGLALVRAGLAWHFTRYSDDPRLAAAEQDARAARREIWSGANPVPPWEFRHPAPVAPTAIVRLHGNTKSLVFHGPTCPDFNCKSCQREFTSVAEARAAGYRPHKACVPLLESPP